MRYALATTLLLLIVSAACPASKPEDRFAPPPDAAVSPEVDPATLYTVTTEGSSTRLKAGEKGKVVISVVAKEGAHVSGEAPLRIALTGKGATLEKTSLVYADSLTKKTDANKYPNPRFEVPFTAAEKGPGSVEAKLTIFICTEKLCMRSLKTVTVPLEIN